MIRILILAGLLLCACKSSSTLYQEQAYYNSYEIVELSKNKYGERGGLYELRINNPKSANDGSVLLLQLTKRWSKRNPGKYQKNINEYEWEGVQLNELLKELTIITDGTETPRDYYTSIIVLDVNNEDCLNPNYKNREMVIKTVIDKLKEMKPEMSDYKAVKGDQIRE